MGWGWSKTVPLPRQQKRLSFFPSTAIQKCPIQATSSAWLIIWGCFTGLPPFHPQKGGMSYFHPGPILYALPPLCSLESGGRTLAFSKLANEAA